MVWGKKVPGERKGRKQLSVGKNFAVGFVLFKSGSFLDFSGPENIALGILHENIRQ